MRFGVDKVLRAADDERGHLARVNTDFVSSGFCGLCPSDAVPEPNGWQRDFVKVRKRENSSFSVAESFGARSSGWYERLAHLARA